MTGPFDRNNTNSSISVRVFIVNADSGVFDHQPNCHLSILTRRKKSCQNMSRTNKRLTNFIK